MRLTIQQAEVGRLFYYYLALFFKHLLWTIIIKAYPTVTVYFEAPASHPEYRLLTSSRTETILRFWCTAHSRCGRVHEHRLVSGDIP